MDERAERCFVEATQDIDLDDDVRAELLDYWRWGTTTIPFADWPHRG
ncbi:MAG: hypothetical protein ACOH16_14030 [Propionibacteriaceae bacterium]